MKLLHYLADTMFARNHLSFINFGILDEFQEISQFFLMPNNCLTEKSLIPYWQQIKNKNQIITASGDLKKFQLDVIETIIKINPDAILFSYIEPPLSPLLIALRKRNNIIKFYYMHHGIYCPGLIRKFEIKRLAQGKHKCFLHFDRLFWTPREINTYFKKIIDISKLTELRGYVGLDLYSKQQKIKLDFNHIPIKGYIMLIGGKFPDEYLNILRQTVVFAEKYSWVILTKMKPNRGVWNQTAKNKLHSHPRVKVLLDYQIIYDYLPIIDMIIVQRYSTVYYEALALNIPVMLCQLKELSIKFQGISKYSMLPQAYSVNKIEKELKKCYDWYQNDDNQQINLERNKYLREQFDTDQLENVTIKILRTILSEN